MATKIGEEKLQKKFKALGLNLSLSPQEIHVITPKGSYEQWGWSVEIGELEDEDFGVVLVDRDFPDVRLLSPHERLRWLENNYEAVLKKSLEKIEKGDIFGWNDLF